MTDSLPPYIPLRDPAFWEAILGDQSDITIVDFHESIEGAPFVWALGNIVLEFSYAEHQLKVLLWNYLGKDFDAGHAITQALGSGSIIQILRDSLKREREPEEVVRVLEFAAKAFEVCRDNRNALAHSMNIHGDDERCIWIRSARKVGFDQS